MKFQISIPFIILLAATFLYGFMLYKGSDLPMGYNDLFAGSGECQMCHNDMVNLQGESVSIVADWRSTMMANAAKDPFWRAKVSHELIVNPALKDVIEDKCTSCHAPPGNFNAHYQGQEYYSIAEMEADPLALDGVQCTVCHQIKEESMGNFSGHLEIGDQKTTWGPYEDPFTMPMINNTGYTPAHGPQITDSRLCGSCHTLLTNSVDLNGQLTGNEFVEQAVYQEWKNSSFPGMNISCQTCHVPRIDDPVKISTMPPWLDPRTPFGMHHLAGANVFMLKILKNNSVELGLTASSVLMDSTISRATRMLQDRSLAITLSEEERTEDTIFVNLKLNNLAGHKFPSGYPSRRVFVSLLVKNETGDTLFYSGKMDGDYQLIQEDMPFEMHHDLINDEGQVQLYEIVMGDVNGDLTTVLLRADHQLKDNRLPPAGFTEQHNSYDTVPIIGTAQNDPNFNKINGNQGSGSDIIHYHIPSLGNTGSLSIIASVYYQTVSSSWLAETFSQTSTEIDRFKTYYEQADLMPVLVAEEEILSTAIGIRDIEVGNSLFVFPNPATDHITIRYRLPAGQAGMPDAESLGSTRDRCRMIEIFSIEGRKVWELDYAEESAGEHKVEIDVRDLAPGIYFIRMKLCEVVETQKLVISD